MWLEQVKGGERVQEIAVGDKERTDHAWSCLNATEKTLVFTPSAKACHCRVEDTVILHKYIPTHREIYIQVL